MTLEEFQAFVAAHADRFVGVHSHTTAELDRMERLLGDRLPEALRWLLTEQGYSECCGVRNLDEAVARTLECRRSISLPTSWLLLDDRGDAGVVLLDLRTGRICWCGNHNLETLPTGQVDADADWFDGYAEWTARCLADLG
jgi:hypothetical protein